MILNPQLGSESAQSRVGKGRVWLGRVGLGLGRIGVSNADSDLGFTDFFRIGNRQLVAGCRFGLGFLNRQLNRQLESESATGAKIGCVRVGHNRVSNADSDLGF